MEQGYGHGCSTWTAVGEATGQGWDKGQGSFFREIAAHVELGMDARLNTAHEFENEATPIDHGTIALLPLHPAYSEGLLGWTAHVRIGSGDKGAKLSSGARDMVLFVDLGEQEGRRSLSAHCIVQQPLSLPAPDAGEHTGWIGLEHCLGVLISTDDQEERIGLCTTLRIGHLDAHQVERRCRRLQHAIVQQAHVLDGTCLPAKPALV